MSDLPPASAKRRLPSSRSEDMRAIERVLDLLLNPLGHADLDQWRRAVMEELRPLLGADMVSFQLPHPGRKLLLSDLDPSLVSTYTREYIPHLDRVKDYSQRMIRLGVGNRRALWQSDLPWLYRTAYYNECIVPMRAFGPIWASAPVPGEQVPAILLAHVDRRYGRRMGRREMDILRVLRPALAASARMVKEADVHRAGIEAVVDVQDAGLMVYSAEGRLLHENPAATRLLDGGGGETARRRAAQVARSTLSAREWVRTVRSPERRRRAGRGGLTLRACRIAPAGGVGRAGAPAVLVLVEEPATGIPGIREIRVRHRLTRRQAEVAVLLAKRATNTEIAETLGISTATARHHTEAAMGALGVKSRREVAGKLTGKAGPEA